MTGAVSIGPEAPGFVRACVCVCLGEEAVTHQRDGRGRGILALEGENALAVEPEIRLPAREVNLRTGACKGQGAKLFEESLARPWVRTWPHR